MSGGIPDYLHDLKQHRTFVDKSFEMENPEDVKIREKENKEKALL